MLIFDLKYSQFLGYICVIKEWNFFRNSEIENFFFSIVFDS